MNNDTYSCSYVEVLEILKSIPIEEYKKIPEDKIIFYENNKDKDYIYIYNEDNKVISRKAKTILINLYKNYIASANEKSKIEEILKLNDIKLEKDKQNKYNPNDLFKNKSYNIKKVIDKQNIKENISMIEYKKQKWYKNIWNNILKIFSNIKQ